MAKLFDPDFDKKVPYSLSSVFYEFFRASPTTDVTALNLEIDHYPIPAKDSQLTSSTQSARNLSSAQNAQKKSSARVAFLKW